MDLPVDAPPIRIREVKVLANDWAVLKKTTFDHQRADGRWQTVSRETYDRGNGVTILLVNRSARTVLLTRQFRFPAYVNGVPDGMLIESCAGVLEQVDPVEAIRQEVSEETGYRVEAPRKLFELFMSPGSVTEKVTFFIADYDSSQKAERGGGLEHEGEDIETLELGFEEAWAMVDDGRIIDGKTVILLQHLKIHDSGPMGDS
ncbi:NUDIX domain-containing protein [Luteolibacter pohnpeiensis]|uniref:GDP-mannose pyrophosphatase n=1 Tax=Luteolibacter pohnpeiensis TaxID=454153 RepID=A0A934S5G4_9BACT|nr:NUDIX domain-containing protein [Luteolibacter pohnpeiensis]MBK1881519.1 NUDIX domain-containing protein [Luteolibacter pohnpeiensis]